MIKRKRRKKSERAKDKERQVGRLNTMWAYLVKYRDGFQSVLSGSDEWLESHHIYRHKGCYHWWSLDGGITVTRGEHFKIHGKGNWQTVEPMRLKIVEYLGSEHESDRRHEIANTYFNATRDETEAHLNHMAEERGIIWRDVIPEYKYKNFWKGMQ